MKKILSNSSIRPKVLRERKDLSPLQKTAIYRYNFEGSDNYTVWFNSLSPIEKFVVMRRGLKPEPFFDYNMKKIKL